MAQNNLTEQELRDKFNDIDTDKNGSLSPAELRNFCQSLPKPPTEDEIHKIFRHMDINDDGKVTFEEFFEWWISKQNNLLPLLYVKQSINKTLSKATNEIKEVLKNNDADLLTASELADFKATFQSGDAQKTAEVDVKVSTHIQSQINAKPYLEALGIQQSTPAVILKLKVPQEKQAEAKATLADLVEQAKELVECILPPEASQAYLSMADIKVEAFESEYLLLSISSNHPMVDSIRSSYTNLLDQFKVTDQSIVLEFKSGCSVDIKGSLEQNSILELAQSTLKGVSVTLEIQAAKTVLKHIKSIIHQTVKQASTYRERKQRLISILLSLINGFSLNVQTEQLSELLPIQKLSKFGFDEVIQKIKKQLKPNELIGSMPIFQDIIDFLANNTESSVSLVSVLPGIYAEFTVRLDNLSELWNKLIG